MKPTAPRIWTAAGLRALAPLLCALVVLATLSVVASPSARAQQPPVDLAVEIRTAENGPNWEVFARNLGSEDAFGVTVRIELHDQELTADSTHRGEYDPSTGVTNVVWSVGRLDRGSSEETSLIAKLAPGLLPSNFDRLAVRGRAVISAADPVEPAALLYNNSAEGWASATLARLVRPALAGTDLQASLDNPLPRDGDTVVLSLNAGSAQELLTPQGWHADRHAYGVKVRVRLPPGLGQPMASFRDERSPTGTSFEPVPGQARTWDWNVGTLRAGGGNNRVQLDLAIPVPSGAEVERKCIAAEMTIERPFDQSLGDDSAEICFVKQVPVLLQDGDAQIWTLYACRDQVPANQCDTAGEVAADVRVTVEGRNLPSDTAVIHVKDVPGRVFDSDDGSVTDGATVSWQTRTDPDPDFTGTREGVKVGLYREPVNRYINNWVNYQVTFKATGLNGEDPPGKISVRSSTTGRAFWPLTRQNSWTHQHTTMYGLSSQSSFTTFRNVEFEELGTYVVDIYADMKHATIDDDNDGETDVFRATGRTIFHVGPVAELEVSSAWQTPDGLRIAAVNNGPDHSPGARAVLTTGQSCDFGGVFPTGDSLRGVGQSTTLTCVIPDVELTDDQLAGTEPIGHIENHVDYTVCIDSDGEDVRPKPDGESACQSEGGTWHAGNVYDYIDGNNDIYLSQGPPPAVDLQPARARTVSYLILSWARLEELSGSPVSHYHVERLDDGEWKRLGSVPQPEDPGEDPEYEDQDEERAPSPRYRVRAVNEEGVAGPWVEAGGPAQPGVVLALDPDTIKEPDADSPGAVTTATVTATLTGAVSSQDITVVVSAAPEDEDGVAYTFGQNRSLTIRAGQRESTGVVTITALADPDGVDERVSITAAASYARGAIRALTLTIVDDDEPGMTLSETALALNEEGATAGYTVALDTQPTSNVVVGLTSNNSEVTVDEGELTFTPDNWGPRTVTVRAANDDDAVDDTASITHRIVDGRSAAEYRSVADAGVAVTVTDNDTAGVTVEAGAPIIVDEGQAGETYTVKLDTEPVGSVRVIASSDNDDVRVSPALFDLTSRNWRQGQTVTVSAAHDQDSDPDTATITHAIDAERTTADEYDGVNAGSVSVSVADDDSPGVQVSPKTRRIAEGRSATYNVRLNTAPSADVTISVSSDNGDVTVGPQTLTFTSANWDRQQRVTITAGQDADAADDAATISHAVTTSDPNYGIPVPDVTVTVDDDDTAGITLGAPSPSPAAEGGTATYSVVLDAQPTSNVVIDLTSDNADVTTDALSLTFTSTNWNEAQAVTLSAAEDDDSIDDTATITHTVQAGSAAEFGGLSETLRVSVADNDVPGITLPDGRLAVKEAGEVTYTVVLQAEPSDGVTVDISSNNGDVTVDPGRLTFTANDWHMPQTVTVRAAADGDGNDDDFTLTHRASSSAASEYRSVRGTLDGTVEEGTINYDSDDNKLIEIRTAAQLDAVRYDLNGDHKADDDADRAAYMRAFPQAGCEDANGVRGACDTIGYELAADIKLSGKWTPIDGFSATLEGNGNAITGLSISLANDDQPVGMFAHNAGEVRNLGLEGVNVRGDGPVGALAGQNSGTITRVHSTGSVYGHAHTGGLVGFNLGTVERSYSEAAVTGVDSQDSGGPLWSVRTAGLVGLNQGTVRNSYATGAVRGAGHVSGLVGWNNAGGVVENSYAAGSVTSTQDFPSTGGLIGWQTARVTGSYWDTEATGQSKGAGQGDPGGAKGLTTKDMKALTAGNTGWDAAIWDFGTNEEYPSLR